MNINSIYIDDTGTPQKSKVKYDPGDWKSYVSVIIDKTQKEEILSTIENLKNKYCVSEFHFTEIFSGGGEFNKFTPSQRIEIFEEFSILYRKFNCPVYIQSLTEYDIIRNEMTSLKSIKKDGFDFSNNSHLCLWLLLLRLAKEYDLEEYEKPFKIIVDAGKQKHNTTQKIFELNGFSVNSEITYFDSNKDNLLQFIDFIAFTLNRVRWIQMNDKKTDSDMFLLEFASKTLFNVKNILLTLVDREDLKNNSMIERYESYLEDIYQKNEDLPNEEV